MFVDLSPEARRHLTMALRAHRLFLSRQPLEELPYELRALEEHLVLTLRVSTRHHATPRDTAGKPRRDA